VLEVKDTLTIKNVDGVRRGFKADSGQARGDFKIIK